MRNAIKILIAVWILLSLFAMALPAVAEGLDPGGNGTSTLPARIELKAERSHVTTDEVDNIKLTAFVYDAQGNPTADGYKVNFTIGTATANNFTGNRNYDYVPGADGRLASIDNPDNFYQGVTCNNSGTVSVQFGWIDEFYAGNNSTIWAYSRDDPGVFASVKIYSAAPMDSLTGYVVDSSGTGLGGINARLHVMGMNGSTPYEIYNMTRTTSKSPPHVGYFAFDYIVMQGTAYGYVDAEARLTDNQTVYGKSVNFSMNRSPMPIGCIVLHAQQPSETPGETMSPSSSARPTPGFEALLALAGLFGIVYLISWERGQNG